jgi:hypothetical protein
MSSPDRWRQVEALFHEALERDPADRAGFLVAACRGDEALRREVASLLQSDAGTDLVDGLLQPRAQSPAWRDMVSALERERERADRADRNGLVVGRTIGSYHVQAPAASAAWARSIARGTVASAATSR